MKYLRRKTFTRSAGPRLFLLSAFLFSSSLHANVEEVLYSNHFSGDTVGEQPADFDIMLPGTNRGIEDSLPIQFQLDGPIGALVVGEASQPQPSLSGTENQSLRIYDYATFGTDSRVYLGRNFVADGSTNRHDLRLDLSFKRTHPYEMDPSFPGDRLLITIGEYAVGQSLDVDTNRGVQVSLANDGEWTARR